MQQVNNALHESQPVLRKQQPAIRSGDSFLQEHLDQPLRTGAQLDEMCSSVGRKYKSSDGRHVSFVTEFPDFNDWNLAHNSTFPAFMGQPECDLPGRSAATHRAW